MKSILKFIVKIDSVRFSLRKDRKNKIILLLSFFGFSKIPMIFQYELRAE